METGDESEKRRTKRGGHLRGSAAAIVIFGFTGMASQNLRDKKLKGQLTGKEKLIGLSAKAAAQTEKVSLGGFVAIYKCTTSCLN